MNEQLITFRCEQNYPEQPRLVTMKSTNAEGLDEVLETFELFLRGCGFVFDGSLRIGEEL